MALAVRHGQQSERVMNLQLSLNRPVVISPDAARSLVLSATCLRMKGVAVVHYVALLLSCRAVYVPLISEAHDKKVVGRYHVAFRGGT